MEDNFESVELTVESAKTIYKPCIVALVGTPGSGKSTLGELLSSQSNFSFFDVDMTRKELEEELKKENKSFSSEKEAMEASYDKNHDKAQQALENNQPAILVATYSRELYHDMLRSLEKETGFPLIVIRVNSPVSKIEKTLEQRRNFPGHSNVTTIEHYNEVANRFQNMEHPNFFEVDTTEKAPEETLEEIKMILKQYSLVPEPAFSSD